MLLASSKLIHITNPKWELIHLDRESSVIRPLLYQLLASHGWIYTNSLTNKRDKEKQTDRQTDRPGAILNVIQLKRPSLVKFPRLTIRPSLVFLGENGTIFSNASVLKSLSNPRGILLQKKNSNYFLIFLILTPARCSYIIYRQSPVKSPDIKT